MGCTVGRQQRSKCGNQGKTDRVEKGMEGIKGVVKGLGHTGGGNEEEQRWEWREGRAK